MSLLLNKPTARDKPAEADTRRHGLCAAAGVDVEAVSACKERHEDEHGIEGAQLQAGGCWSVLMWM